MTKKTEPTIKELVRMPVVLRVPGMDQVDVRRDQAYRTVDGHALCMDLYAPLGSSEPRPAVILIHGGPVPRLGARNMGIFTSYGRLLAASGLVAVAFDHRFLGPDRMNDAADDVAVLIDHVRSHADSLGVDPLQLALWAFSGGGPFLAAPLREGPPWLRAAVAYYAVLDLQEPPPEIDDGLSPQVRTAFSAVESLGKDGARVPPLLVARAGLDNPWLNGGIDRFVSTAVAGGATIDLLNHPAGRHFFDVLDDDARSRQIIRRTLHFLLDHLAVLDCART